LKFGEVVTCLLFIECGFIHIGHEKPHLLLRPDDQRAKEFTYLHDVISISVSIMMYLARSVVNTRGECVVV
jgi:hypothetical protein